MSGRKAIFARRNGDCYLNEIQNSLLDYCREQGRENLLEQWDTARNGTLTPSDVSYGSYRHVWWKCEKGHNWQARISSRVTGNAGCRVCDRCNRLKIPLVKNYPEIAAQWHPTKNLPAQIEEFGCRSKANVWWKCEKGHSWQAQVFARVNGNSCPVCSKQKTNAEPDNLASACPEIAAQWHPEKNGDLRPNDVKPYSNRKVWWVCDNGHEFETYIKHRTRLLSGCPVCAGRKVVPGENDLATEAPELAAQWHKELNKELTPQMVTAGRGRKVWWKCQEGHVWMASIASRARGARSGCPVCAGKVKKEDISQYLEPILDR